MRKILFATSILSVIALASACGQPKKDNGTIPTPTPGPGARALSISMAPAHLPSPSTQDFIDAVNLAKGAGCKGNFQSYTWSALEAMPNVIDSTRVGNDIDGAVSAGFTTQYLGIQMINTTAKEVPSDLQTVAWTDSSMKARFHLLVDAIAPKVAGKIQYFGIGNEVDVYLESQNQWTPFQSFLEDGIAYVHTKLPGVKVGTTITFSGAQNLTAKMNTLTAMSDVMIFTDYPLGASFHPLGASHGATDLDLMVTLAGAKKVIVQEFGYPADSTYLGSSEDEQAAFFSNGLAEWAGLGGEKIPFLNVFLMHDFSAQMCADFATYYGDPNNNDFKAYLCSIGLRKNDGTPRKAWNAFVTGAANTGF